MTLDPAPPVVGDEAGRDGAGRVDAGRIDAVHIDAVRIRATVERQWRDRRALERQLHDGAALRISALALRLGLLRHAMPGGPEFGAAVDELQDELHLALQELRDVAGRLYPPLLDEAGLGPALREVAARCPVPVRVDAPDERFGAAAEGAAYFALLGCLPLAPPGTTPPGPEAAAADGVGPDGSGAVDIVVRRDAQDGQNVLVVLVSGVAACHAASVDDGVRLLGGTVAVGGGVSGVPAATQITVRIPCA